GRGVNSIYHRICDQFGILDAGDVSRADDFAGAARWLESPGCVLQRSNFVLDSEIRTEVIVKAGLFVSVVLKGSADGGPRHGTKRFRYAENTLVVMALKRPVLCDGEAPRGAHIFAAGRGLSPGSLAPPWVAAGIRAV